MQKDRRPKITHRTKKLAASVTLLTVVGLCIYIVILAQKPLYCPISQGTSSIKIDKLTGLLNENAIPYKIDEKTNQPLINAETIKQTNEALSDSNLKVVYSLLYSNGDTPQICTVYLTNSSYHGLDENLSITEKPWFFKAIKLVGGGLVIIFMMIVIVQPLLEFLFPEQDNNKVEVSNAIENGTVIETPFGFKIIGTALWPLMYLASVSITFSSFILDRTDTGIVLISVIVPLIGFYSTINGMMSVEFYSSKLTVLDHGLEIESKGIKKDVLWSELDKVKVVNSARVIHIYNMKKERVFSVSTDVPRALKLVEFLKQKII